MKPIKLIVLLCLGLSAKAQTTYPNGITGCIARWTFDVEEAGTFTNLPDVSGNNHHGTPTDIVSTNGFRNKPLKAGAFNGSSSWAQVAHHSMLNPNEITIVSLVKMNSFYSGTCQGNNIIYKGFDYNTDLSWSQYIAENDGNCSLVNPSIEKLVFAKPSLSYLPPSGNFIATNKWYLLITSDNGSSIKHYQIEMDTNNYLSNISATYVTSSNLPLGNSTEDVYIGATQNPPFPYWTNGSIDEVVLFNKALSQTEIQSVYDYLWGFSTDISNAKIQDNILSIHSKDKNLFIKSDSEIKSISIFDLSGRRLANKINNTNYIDLSYLNSQMLVCEIIIDKNKSIKRKILLK